MNALPSRAAICLGALLSLDDNTCVRLMWFNQAFRKTDLLIGTRLMATGIIKSTGTSWEIIHPLYVKLGDDEVPEELKPLPVYSLTEGLQQSAMRKMFRTWRKATHPTGRRCTTRTHSRATGCSAHAGGALADPLARQFGDGCQSPREVRATRIVGAAVGSGHAKDQNASRGF